MKLSAICTLYERPIPVLEKVFDSLKEQSHDELVIVFDRTPVVLADFVEDWWKGDGRLKVTELGGEPGWRSPVPAWNAGFAKATGDVYYCFSSETVQAEGNLARARDILVTRYGPGPVQQILGHSQEVSGLQVNPICLHGSASCSCGPEGTEVNWGGTAPGNLLCDAAHPRPLGFIWAAPAWAVKQIGGMDPEFAKGLWHDDDDLFLRLWRTGLDFVFDDSISGIHQHHERPVLALPEWQEAIARNQEYMLRKHGTLTPWESIPRLEEKKPGRTTWRHL